MSEWKGHKLGDNIDMYTKTGFPIHEEGNMHIKTLNHIHVNHHIDIS